MLKEKVTPSRYQVVVKHIITFKKVIEAGIKDYKKNKMYFTFKLRIIIAKTNLLSLYFYE